MDNENTTSTFVPPRHWIGPEELEPSYWSDPATREKRGQEFFEKPVEWLEKMDRSPSGGLARRDFLTIMGASVAMTSFACARRPVHKIIPYVVKPEEIIPGVATFYASTFNEGPESCGVVVKTVEGRPIKLEGNPDHPMNRGALSTRGQAAVLDLYDPDRLKQPVARGRAAGGGRRELPWNEADAAILAKLKGARKVRVLSDELQSETTRRLVGDFLRGFSDGKQIEFDTRSMEEIAEAQSQSYGNFAIPSYRFDLADVVVSLSADFLGTWLSPVEYTSQWSRRRKLNSKDAAHADLSKLYCFEPMMTLTGANADERFSVRPGDELKVALAIAHEIIVTNRQSPYASDSAVMAALSGYTPEAVAAELKLDGGAGKIKQVARDLWEARGKSLVVAGGLHAKTAQSVSLQVVVNLLNSALGNEGVTVDGSLRARTAKSRFADLAQLAQEMKSGQVDVLVIYRSNPAYRIPKAVLDFEGAMTQVPLVIAITDREDETAIHADYVLPDHHFLENWGDANPRKGLYSLQQPTLAPIHSTRAFEDSLLSWAKGMGKASGLMAQAADWHAYLQGQWKEIYQQNRIPGNFEQFWEGVLRDGVFDADRAQGRVDAKPAARSFRSGSVARIPRYSKEASNEIVLALYESVQMGDGSSANNAWLQEMPDPISSVTWDNYLNVAPSTAKQMGLKTGDVVEVKASSGLSAELPVYVQPGMHPSVVSAAVGYGRRNVGKVGNGAGVDLYPFVKAIDGALVFSGQPVTVKKTGRLYKLAMTQWHTASENRPIINDVTLAEYRKNPASEDHTDPHLRMKKVPTLWPVHEYKGYRWGMAIDLNSCTGCGACMVACQAENNVPVVGRDQVRNSRQMHWLRIDRYYSGSPEKPDVIFQPMLCQHCENAPCETVCPVLATVHDDEGLNVQVYNRCVGTRYCQNNCPYKVRRFNFFDHWKSYEGTMNLAWNPDVTVRTRGIMEKCTFCVQRIRDAKDKAKDKGVKVVDGTLKTACQQTCPTEAIVFGDVNDPKSRVSGLRADARAFKVLEVLNAQPMISYLTKVRNKEGGEGAGHHTGQGTHHS